MTNHRAVTIQVVSAGTQFFVGHRISSTNRYGTIVLPAVRDNERIITKPVDVCLFLSYEHTIYDDMTFFQEAGRCFDRVPTTKEEAILWAEDFLPGVQQIQVLGVRMRCTSS